MKISRYLSSVCKRLKEGTNYAHGRNILPNNYIDFETFAIYLKKRGLRERSIKNYLINISHFRAEVRPETLREFHQYIIGYKQDDIATRRRLYKTHLAMRFYLRSLDKRAWIRCLPSLKDIRIPKVGRHDKSFSCKVLRVLCENANTDYKIFMKVAYFSGLRISEALWMKINWIDFNKKPVEVIIPDEFSKSGGVAYLPDDRARELKAYLCERYRVDEDSLKTNRETRDNYVFNFLEMGTRKIKDIEFIENEQMKVLLKLRKIAERSGLTSWIKKLSPHCFRHSFAHDLLKRGFTLPEIQVLMRHESSDTTSRYLTVAEEGLKRKFDAKYNV
jgi:integrase